MTKIQLDAVDGLAIRTLVGVFAFILYCASLAAAAPPALQHPSKYTGNEAVTGWLMSEKLDGIRGYWNGKKLLTRKGKPIHAPAWFTKNFPPFPLDGELWHKRNDFNFVQNTVLDEVPSQNWKKITYNIFEVPKAAGDFPTRLEKARQWFKAHPAPQVRIIKQIVCKGQAHLQAFLKKIESLGGEGVVIRDPRLPYRTGRLPDVLKVKRFSDMEGTVIGYKPGKGKFKGMMGSLTLRLDNGIAFNLGSGFSDAERRDPPPIGAVVTFKYKGFTKNGIPRFASFMRVRKD
jgi:DNA ligase 1